MAFPLVWRSTYVALQRKYGEANAEIENLQKLIKQNEVEIEDLKKLSGNSVSNTSDDVARQFTRLLAENERLSRELNEVGKECQDYKQQIGKLQGGGSSADFEKEKASLEEGLQQAEAKIKKLKKENDDLEDELKSVKKQRDEAREKVDALEVKLHDAEKERDKLSAGFEKEKAALEEGLHQAEAKIKKLEKENDDLEDEKDDLEDELKSAKKQRDEAKAAIDELDNKLHDVTKERNTLSDKNERLEREKQKAEADSKGKAGALAFVGEILKAEPIGDDDIVRTERAVDALVDFIEHDLIAARKEADYVIDEFSSDPTDDFSESALTSWAAKAKKTWVKGKKSIAFVGEFSAGKTSMVNRILGTKDLLQVSAKATTAIPTYVCGGPTEDFRFVSPDDKMKKLSKETFVSVSKEVLANVEGLPNLLKYFVMTSNLPILDGISILDTPGFDSNDPEDAMRTIGVINECDALYWVFDVNRGTVNRASLKLIKENLHRPLFVVINKCDTKSPGEVASVERLIRDTFQSEGVEVRQFIRFSEKEDPAVILNPLNDIELGSDDWSMLCHLDLLCNSIGWRDAYVKSRREIDKQETQRVSDWLDAFKSEFQEIANRCDNVKEAVDSSWTTHTFRSDKYELSAGQGSYVKSTLSELSNLSRKEIKDIRDFADVVSTANDVHNDHMTNKNSLKVLYAAKEAFVNKIEEYMPGFKQSKADVVKSMIQSGRDDFKNASSQNN